MTYITGLSEELSSQIKYFVPEVKVAPRPPQKLNQFYSKLKQKLNKADLSGVVYGITCKEQDVKYIGETIQKIGKRTGQHKNYCTEANLAKFNKKRNALACRAKERKHELNFDMEEVEVLKRESNKTKLLIQEINEIIMNEGLYALLNTEGNVERHRITEITDPRNQVSKRINTICQRLLNCGFNKIIKRHAQDMKKIKSMLPRRESERRHHPLIKHADILTCIETRLSMLSMTYAKYIDLHFCCFIPGKIIDEVLNILRLVSNTANTNKQLRAHEVLQELRDISSMAIDHFDEKIVHIFRKNFCDMSAQKFGSSIYQILQSTPLDTAIAMQSSEMGLTSFVHDDSVKADTKPAVCPCADEVKDQINRLHRNYNKVMRKVTQLSFAQAKQSRAQSSTALSVSEMSSLIVDLRRRLEESEAKNREIAANFNQIATMEQPGTSGNKPRAATAILKRRINEQGANDNKKWKPNSD